MDKEKCCCVVQEEKNTKKQWLIVFFVVIFLVFFYKIFQNFNFEKRLGIANPNANYGTAFLVGVVASVTSCMAIVGSVVIIYSERYETAKKDFFSRTIKPNLFFHFGRLSGFFFLGGLLGLIGGEMNLGGNFIAIYMFIITIIMALLGLNMLGIFSEINHLRFVMPKFFGKLWDKLTQTKSDWALVFLGILSFFLPCGFTQSMQIIALASGSFLRGALTMFFFALGTMPALMMLGVTSSWTSNKNKLIFQKVAGILILMFTIYSFNSAMALFGMKNNIFEQQQNNGKENLGREANGKEQVIEMRITEKGFEPNEFKIKKGIPVRWIIMGDDIIGCTSKIIVPELNITKTLNYGTNTVFFVPNKVGDIPFSCWMGMVRGKFSVED